MFDDPNKELKALEGQLLATEKSQDNAMLDEKEFETLYNEIRSEFTPRVEEPPIRNFANGYGRTYTPAPQPAYRPAPAPVHKKHKQKGNGGLGFLLFLELVAITVVLGFWALYLMR